MILQESEAIGITEIYPTHLADGWRLDAGFYLTDSPYGRLSGEEYFARGSTVLELPSRDPQTGVVIKNTHRP